MPSHNDDDASPLCGSDVEIYTDSGTDQEDYGSVELEWEVEKVLGAEIDRKGKRRYVDRASFLQQLLIYFLLKGTRCVLSLSP